MLIYVKIIKKKLFTDRQTDIRTTQNYSSEPHNKTWLGSFLQIGQQNQIKPICFLESSASPFYQKKNLRGIFISKKIKILVLDLFSF